MLLSDASQMDADELFPIPDAQGRAGSKTEPGADEGKSSSVIALRVFQSIADEKDSETHMDVLDTTRNSREATVDEVHISESE
jgi:hypothetical protein